MIENILSLILGKKYILVVLALGSLWVLSRWIVKERKIQALGGHAYRVKTYLPFGEWPVLRINLPTVFKLSSPLLHNIQITNPSKDIDFIIYAIRGTISHKNLETWLDWFTTPTGLNYTVEVKPATRRIVFTADPENIKAILATQFTDYGKGELMHAEWKDFLGDSIFVTDGDQWHNSRQLIRPQFIKDRVSDLDVFEKHVGVLIGQIEGGGFGEKGVGSEIDISDLFFRFTLDAATDFLLGRSVNSLEVPEQEFAEAFGEVQRVQNIIARAGYVSSFLGSMSVFLRSLSASQCPLRF